MNSSPDVIVAFCPPDPTDWLSRICGWFCRRADGCPYSHATLIVGKKVYEWRVGGLSAEDQLQWLVDTGSSRPPTYLYVKLSDSQLLRLLYIIEAMSYTPGARYSDFINFALERRGWLLCTGFIRLCLGMEVYNSTPLRLYEDIVEKYETRTVSQLCKEGW